jgi:hypothetical protein
MRSSSLTKCTVHEGPLTAERTRRVRFSLLPTRHTMWALVVMILAVTSAYAMPLKEYRERTDRAVRGLELAAELGSQRNIKDWDRTTAIVDGVINTFPRGETVEWDGRRISVNTEWLAEDLKRFQATPFGDPKRKEILQHAIDRLRALDARLEEVDLRTGPVAAPAKAEDKSRLQQISDRAVFKPKPPQENIFVRTWKRFWEWVWSLFRSGGSLEAGSMSWASFMALILIYGLALGLLGYAVSKLIPYFQRGRGKRQRPDARIVLGERLAPDQTASDLLAEAEALARGGELRAAIRKAYIALLCELGDRKILTLAQNKTNRDYLRAVRDKRPLLAEMQRLTSSFEDHWYGSRQTSTDDWTAFRAGYEKVLSS